MADFNIWGSGKKKTPSFGSGFKIGLPKTKSTPIKIGLGSPSKIKIGLGSSKKSKRKRTLTSADKKRIAAKQKWRCKICGHTLPVRYHIDHIKEFSKHGSDKESNLQALCGTCHDNKTEEDRHMNKKKKKSPSNKSPFSGFGF